MKGKKGRDDYIHLYIIQDMKKQEVLKPEPKMAVHKPNLQAKPVMAPNK